MSTRKEAHIQMVETTFRSCFCFRFLKYPLFKKVVSFWVPEIFSFLETFGNKKVTKVKETETSQNRPKFWEQKSRFHYLCIHVVV